MMLFKKGIRNSVVVLACNDLIMNIVVYDFDGLT